MTNEHLTKEKILRELELHKGDLRQKGVKKIGLFGSYLYNQQTKKSDLDFLVTFEKITFDNYIGVKFFLEKIFKKKVDLVIERTLKPQLMYVKGEAKYAKGL